MDVDQVSPRPAEGLAEIPYQLRSDLPQGLRLAGELAHVVAVVDQALAEAAPRMHDGMPPRTDQPHFLCSHVGRHDEARPLARYRVVDTFDPYQRSGRDVHVMRALSGKRVSGQRQHPALLCGKQTADGACLAITTAPIALTRVEPREQCLADLTQVCSARDRHEVLPANRFAARLHSSLVVAGRRTAEARLEEIVRRERFEALR
jgi:hypothetical protein